MCTCGERRRVKVVTAGGCGPWAASCVEGLHAQKALITPRCLDRDPTRSPARGGSKDPSLTQPHVDEPRGHSHVSRSLKDKPQESAHGRDQADSDRGEWLGPGLGVGAD